MNKDQDLGKENDFKRISWMKDMINEERVESVRMDKEGGQEGKNTLVGQEHNRRKEEVDLEDGFEGKREQYLKGEVMEIDIGNPVGEKYQDLIKRARLECDTNGGKG